MNEQRSQRVMSAYAAHGNRARPTMEKVAHPVTLAYDKDGEAHVCHFVDRDAARAHLIECATGAWALVLGNGIIEAGSTPPVQRRSL